MLALKLAYRNLIGKKLSAWLNVGVLSFTYVLIIWHQGILSGMYQQAAINSIKDEIGGGQYWHEKYDPFDPLTLEDAHGPLTPELSRMIKDGRAAAVLIPWNRPTATSRKTKRPTRYTRNPSLL